MFETPDKGKFDERNEVMCLRIRSAINPLCAWSLSKPYKTYELELVNIKEVKPMSQIRMLSLCEDVWYHCKDISLDLSNFHQLCIDVRMTA